MGMAVLVGDPVGPRSVGRERPRGRSRPVLGRAHQAQKLGRQAPVGRLGVVEQRERGRGQRYRAAQSPASSGALGGSRMREHMFVS